MNDVNNILSDREKTHGDFVKNASYSQSIKVLFRLNKDLTAEQLESLDLIATKLGRIISGDANTIDHWDDIAGYATLASKELKK